jgi:hypothetical protein
MVGHALSILAALSLASCRPAGASAPPPPSGCEVTVVGPLVPATFVAGPAPTPTGGAITDGDYDMVAYVVHGENSGRSRDGAGFRFTARFATTERSPNHAQGRVAVMVDVPPARTCKAAPFATVQNELRGIDSRGEVSSTPYSASPNQLVIHQHGIDIVLARRP